MVGSLKGHQVTKWKQIRLLMRCLPHIQAINGGIYMIELELGFIAAMSVVNLIVNIIILAIIYGMLDD